MRFSLASPKQGTNGEQAVAGPHHPVDGLDSPAGSAGTNFEAQSSPDQPSGNPGSSVTPKSSGEIKREEKERKEREKKEKKEQEARTKAEAKEREKREKEEKKLREEEGKRAEKERKQREREAKKGGKAPPTSDLSVGPQSASSEILVEMTGQPVLVPTYDDLEKYRSITYPVREPYQYINIQIEEGRLVYHSLEPSLSKREKEVMAKAADGYEMLVNVNSVLVNVEDKVQFLDDAFKEIMAIYDMKLTDLEYKRILYHIERDYVGFGKIDALVKDKFIEDISCNGPDRPVFVYHRFFESMPTNVVFDEVELNSFILRLAQISGRHISILQPIRDAALPDGSRINMTLGKEVTKKGSTFTIRKFRSDPISPTELILLRTGDARIFAYLWLLIEYGRSFLISGGTAAGKTTLLNAVSMFIRPESKIVSVEDTPEINLAHPNWIQAVTRIGFGEGGSGVSGVSGISGVSSTSRSAGDITLFELLIAALRQRPDFIIVGEVRGEEAYTLFQAMSVGHATMGTIHAASMPELIARVESQPMNVPRVMEANLDLVIFVAAVRRGDEKVRRVRDVIEILGQNPTTKELITNVVFRWDPIKDGFEYSGRSFQLEKISSTTGVPLQNLEAEIRNRMLLIEKMVRERIYNYKEVTDIVRQYYVDREFLLQKESLTAVVDTTTPRQPSTMGQVDWSDTRR